MNAALQCLIRVFPLVDYCCSQEWKSARNATNALGSGGAVLDSFCGFVSSMRRGSGGAVSAQSLHVAIGRHNRTFADRKQHDSYEFLVVLLDVLSEDLNQSPRARGERRPPGLAGLELHEFCQRSIISDLFHGFTRTEITYDCGHREILFEPLVGWPLPFPSDGQKTSLEECIEQWRNPELLSEDNWLFCEHCDKQESATRQTSVMRFAPILVIQLRRFKVGHRGKIRKNSAPVRYPMTIKAQGYETDAAANHADYALFGVVVHCGTESGGHYTALVRDIEEGSPWFDISDSSVRPIAEDRVVRPDAYLLFYARKDIREYWTRLRPMT
jgi:ubiquitin C-terminal hydrolase